MTSSKSHDVGGDFDHLVAYSMVCTLENEDVNAMEYGRINFGSLDEVIKVDDLDSFYKGYRALRKGVEVCIDQGKARGNKVQPRQHHRMRQQAAGGRTASPSFVSFCFLLRKCLGFKPFGPRVSNMS